MTRVQQCHELVWSPDGRRLAVVSSHVARAVVVDVAWALSAPETPTAYWSWRSVSLAPGDTHNLARRLRLVTPEEIEYEVCPHQFGRGIDWRTCTAPAVVRRLRLPHRAAA